MIRSIIICALALTICACSNRQSASANKNTLIGSWELQKWTAQKGTENEFFPYGENAFGRLAYMEDGSMFLTLMKENRDRFPHEGLSSGTVEENDAAFRSFFHYTASYSVNPDSSFVVHTVEACTNPNWIGEQQRRNFRIMDDTLFLSSPKISTAVSGDQPAVHQLKWIRSTN